MEIAFLQRQFRSLEEGQTIIQKQNEGILFRVERLDDDMQKMSSAIKGDPDIGHAGMVKRVELLELFMRRQDKIYQKILGAGTVVGILWTLLMKFWDKIFG